MDLYDVCVVHVCSMCMCVYGVLCVVTYVVSLMRTGPPCSSMSCDLTCIGWKSGKEGRRGEEKRGGGEEKRGGEEGSGAMTHTYTTPLVAS